MAACQCSDQKGEDLMIWKWIVASMIALLPVVANAQMTARMADIRCGQYLAMSANQSRDFSSWLGGWYSYKTGRTKIDLIAHEKNIISLKNWCKYRSKEAVMSGLDNIIVKD
jgi:hypothetical protein